MKFFCLLLKRENLNGKKLNENKLKEKDTENQKSHMT